MWGPHAFYDMSVLQYFHLILGTACTISVRSPVVLTYHRIVFDNSYRMAIHYIVCVMSTLQDFNSYCPYCHVCVVASNFSKVSIAGVQHVSRIQKCTGWLYTHMFQYDLHGKYRNSRLKLACHENIVNENFIQPIMILQKFRPTKNTGTHYSVT